MKTVEQVEHIIQQYWRSPDPAVALDALDSLAATGYFKQKEGIAGVLAFFAAIASSVQPSGGEFYAVALKHGFRLPGATDIRDRMARMPAGTAADLDVLWSFYFATGEIKYVDRVIAVSRGRDATLMAVASWSLQAIGRDHPEVLDRMIR